MAVYIVVSSIFQVTAMPFQFIDLAVGFVYDFKTAVLLLLLSKMSGSAISFAVAHYFFSDQSRESYKSSEYLYGMSEMVKKEPFKYGLLIRFAAIPQFVRNYGLALLPIQFNTYMLVVFLQSCSSAPLQAYMGSQIDDFVDYIQNAGQKHQPPIELRPHYNEDGDLLLPDPALVAEWHDLNPPPPSQPNYAALVLFLGIAITVYVGTRLRNKVKEI